MSGAAAQRQQMALLVLLAAVSYATARMVASASTELSLTYVIGAIACILSFLNAEVAVYFLIAAMLLSPEVDVGAGGTQGATLKRAVTLRVDDLVLLIICLTWFLKSVLYKEINLLKRTPLNGAMYLYAFAAIFSTMLGVLNGNVDPKTGFLFVLKYIEYFLVFWMVINTVQNEGQIRRFVMVTILVALVVSLVAVSQIPGGQRVSAPFEGENGEPNTLGGYLLFIVCILAAFVLTDNTFRIPALVLLVIAFIAFTYTLSRASYLGLVPAAIVLPFLMRRYVILVGAVVLVLMIGAFAEELLPRVVYDRIAFTFTQEKMTRTQQLEVYGQRLDTSTTARLLVMQASIDAFYEKPVFGYGVTGWHFLDSQYFRSLAETGLFGVATLFFLIFRVLQVTWHTILVMHDRDPFYFALACGFFAGTLGLMVHALGSNTFIIVRIMEPFWLVCAVVYLLPSMTLPAHAEQQTA